MSRTLFWYVFKDLLKIFLMASGALAGIMSFGGLLRPLTQNGLDGSQVALLLRYSMPAMSTYSLPVAALFATTVVFGRMAADNEITACRASGISFLSMTTPAMLLGLLVSIGSMFLLCFTVPNATLKIEQVVMSNLAKLVVHQIDQAHETHFGGYTIFAQDAYLAPTDSLRPNEQAVVLRGPLIVNYTNPPNPPDKWFHIAKDFYSAREAIAYIHQDPEEGAARLRVVLTDGVVFPRRLSGPKSEQGGLGSAQFGQVEIPSQLEQKTKFMNIFQLKDLERDPARGRNVRRVTAKFIREDQAHAYAAQLARKLNDLNDGTGKGTGKCVLQTIGETFSIFRDADTDVSVKANTITLNAPPGGKPLIFRQESSGQVRLTAESTRTRISVEADSERDQLVVSVDMRDALVDAGDTQSPKAELSRKIVVPMPQTIAAMKGRTARQYLESNVRPEPQRQQLLFAWVDLINHIRSELHARLAFVISCLLLVLVGAALGMMFRSGNFLTAFAVSVIPAMLSVVLIVTGQHTAENVPQWIRADNNPLNAGITIIWAGNVVIAIAAVVLLWRLQRK